MRRHSSPAALALVFLAATAAADVLHLHDGTRITGNVTACDEEQCTVDKRQVPFTDIARITLGSSSPPRATNRGEGVVLKDGAFRSGKFTGLTLGYVEIGAEEIDRADVAEIVLIAVNRPDVIIGIDGAARTGALTTCNAASCTLDARAIALPDIRWIGLAPEDATPPQAGDADLVFTGEDATPGRLSGLDETTVRTTRGSFPRDRVTWIRLAPPPAPQPTAQPPIYRPSPDPPSPPPPRRPDAPGSPSTEPRTPSTEPPSSGSTPPASSPRRQRPPIGRRLWIGEMQGYLWGAEEGNAEDLRVFVDVRLQEIGKRELTDGAGKKIGELIMLSAAGSVVRNTHRYRGIDRCDGEGTVTVADEGAGTFANSLFRKTAPGAMPGVFGDEVPVGKELYMLWVGPTNRMFPVVCYDESGSRSTTLPYIVPMAGTLPTGTVSFDPHLRYLQDGKMIGSYTVTGDAQMYGNVSRTNASLSWSICLEDTVCPPVVPPQEPRRGENDPLAPRDLPAGTDWCAEVERLLQLLRTEQSKLLGHQKAVRDAEMEVGAALDVIWGWDGAMRKYFTSLLSLVAIFSSPKVEKAIDLSVFLMNTDASGSQQEMQDAMDALYERQDLVMLAAEQQGLAEATRRAAAVLRAEGTDSEALQTYAKALEQSEKLQKLGADINKGLDFMKAIKENHADAKAFGEAIIDYDRLERDRKMRQAERDQCDENILDLRFQIEQARRACAAQKESASLSPAMFASSQGGLTPLIRLRHLLPSPEGRRIPQHTYRERPSRRLRGEGGRRPGEGPISRATGLTLALREHAAGGEVAQGSAADPQTLAARLERSAQHLDQISIEMEAATKWLLPFALRVTSGVDERFLKLLIVQAAPHLQAVRTNFEAAKIDAAAFEREVEQAVPKANAAPKGKSDGT